MKALTARRLAWSLGIAAIALLLGTLVIMFIDRHVVLPQEGDAWSVPGVLDVCVNVGVPVIGIVIASGRRENRIGWLLLVGGVALGLTAFGRAYGEHALLVDTGSLPGGRLFSWISGWTWAIPICLLPFLLLIFPTGRVPSRQWRPVAWLDAAVLGVLTFTALLLATASLGDPFGATGPADGRTASIGHAGFVVAVLGLPLALLGSFAAVVVRYRSARGDERLQLKWFATAAGVVAVTFSVAVVSNSIVASIISDLALVFLYVAIGIAIMKHRLYDIDLIINKAVVYGGLAAFITVVYVVVVVLIGAFVGATEGLSILATAIVAVAFQPARARVQRLANRLIYGERATPYEVLTEFSKRIGETWASEDVLQRVARLLAESTGASSAAVWLRVGPTIGPAASWPLDAPKPRPLALNGEHLPQLDGVTAAVAVQDRGELLGALVITKPARGELSPTEEQLVTDLALQASLLLRNFQLIEDLRGSRQRLVAAQDEERRRLERNLHDGAQQELVALAVRLKLARSTAREDLEKADEMLGALETGLSDALTNLRDLARGIYPPLLADRGLLVALEAQARKAALPIEVEVDGVDRYPQDVEAAVYFCVLEALQNAAKYADASHVVVRLSKDDGDLRFAVQDDGRGFDQATAQRGAGVQNMTDRVAALGGELSLLSRPGEGTTVLGRVPAAPSR